MFLTVGRFILVAFFPGGGGDGHRCAKQNDKLLQMRHLRFFHFGPTRKIAANFADNLRIIRKKRRFTVGFLPEFFVFPDRIYKMNRILGFQKNPVHPEPWVKSGTVGFRNARRRDTENTESTEPTEIRFSKSVRVGIKPLKILSL